MAQSLELNVAMHRALEVETAKLAENMNRLTEHMNTLTDHVNTLTEDMDKFEERMDGFGQRMDKLTTELIAPIARMVLIHEQRLNRVDPAESSAR